MTPSVPSVAQNSIPTVTLLVLLCFMGCLVGGPNNIITSAVAADLSEDPSIKGNNKALGTVTGIINGSGSVTAAFGQMAIPVLAKWGEAAGVGYRYVWFFLVFCTAVGTLLLGPKVYKELFIEHAAPSPLAAAASASAKKGGYQTVATNPLV